MIARKPCTTVPYSCLTSLKLHNSRNLPPVQNDESNAKYFKPTRYQEEPLLWKQFGSYLCKVDSQSIVRKLDINSMIMKNGKGANTVVYESLTRHQINNNYKHILPHLGKSQNINIKDNITHPLLLYSNLYFMKRNLNEKENDKYKFKRVQGEPRTQNNTDLPSSEQLDEMMSYMADQASNLFTTKGWSYQNCSYKIIFENNLIGTRTESLNAYILQINLMKHFTKLILSNPDLTIIRMTKNITDGSIQIRWQVDGVPRYFKPFSLFGLIDDKRFVRYIDGFSIFYVKSDGLYHKHVLMKMTPLRNESKRSLFNQILANLGFYGSSGYDTGLQKQPAIPSFQDHNQNNKFP